MTQEAANGVGMGGPRINARAETTNAPNLLASKTVYKQKPRVEMSFVLNRRAKVSLRRRMQNRTCTTLWTPSTTWLPHVFQITSPSAATINMERITNNLAANYKRFTKVYIITLRKSG